MLLFGLFFAFVFVFGFSVTVAEDRQVGVGIGRRKKMTLNWIFKMARAYVLCSLLLLSVDHILD